MSVLDASVVLKWFVSEKDSDKAEMLRSEYYLGQREIIARDNNVTCYDAIYFALAQDLQTDFITADQKFYDKLFQNDRQDVILLRNYK